MPDVRDAIRIGVSSCLLGERVRWDGGHKRDAELLRELSGFVEWVGMCPEVEVGMGVPRPALQLVRTRAGPRLVEAGSERDRSDEMKTWATARVCQLHALDLGGYIFKARSPSCRLLPTPGLYAAALLAAMPDLPVAEAEALRDPGQRARFLERARAHQHCVRTRSTG